MRVAIVGAGLCGLCMTKQLIDKGVNDITVFEQKDHIGGLWSYDPNPNSSNTMYASLTTNLPRILVQFPDFTIESHNHNAYNISNGNNNEKILFPTHKQVLKYLKLYSKKFNILKYIKFKHKVISVLIVKHSLNRSIFRVIVKDLINNINIKYEFDAFIVCNGHYNDPFIPVIQNIIIHQIILKK